MAPTRDELLAFLRQMQADNPQMTKEELSASALAHFSKQSETQSSHDIYLPAGRLAAITLIEQAVSPTEQPSIPEPMSEAEPERKTLCWPVINRKLLISTLGAATFFSVVLAGVCLLMLYKPSQPSRVDLLASVAVLSNTPPAETGEIARFGKRFTDNASYYDDKYRNQVLEMVGVVEIVERNAEGDLQATLLLVDRQNTVYRAQFRFLPEQQEAIQLTRGAMAVLKGKYAGYSDKVMKFYPSVIVYNSAQPNN